MAVLTTLHRHRGESASHTSILKACSGLQCHTHSHTHRFKQMKNHNAGAEVYAMQCGNRRLRQNAQIFLFIATIGSSLIWHVWERKWNLAFKILGLYYHTQRWCNPLHPHSLVWPSCSTAMWVLTLFTSSFFSVILLHYTNVLAFLVILYLLICLFYFY